MAIPKSYTAFEEYIDSAKATFNITWLFYSPAVLPDILINIQDNIVSIKYAGGNLLVDYKRDLPIKLFQFLETDTKAHKVIIGYISNILPEINTEIGKLKYLSGHVLSKTFSIFDISDLKVRNDIIGEIAIIWPPSFTNFPPSEQLASGSDHIFIRDLIDAITAYFEYRLDDCIRKIITSFENFCHYKQINGTFNERLNKSLLEKYYLSQWNIYIPMLKSNLKFIYKLRNGIVHDKLRIRFSDRWICKKGIGTLSYVYQTQLLDQQTFKYIFSLIQQFLLLENECEGFDLDRLEQSLQKQSDAKMIYSSKDLDEFMFSGLKISEKEKEVFKI